MTIYHHASLMWWNPQVTNILISVKSPSMPIQVGHVYCERTGFITNKLKRTSWRITIINQCDKILPRGKTAAVRGSVSNAFLPHSSERLPTKGVTTIVPIPMTCIQPKFQNSKRDMGLINLNLDLTWTWPGDSGSQLIWFNSAFNLG